MCNIKHYAAAFIFLIVENEDDMQYPVLMIKRSLPECWPGTVPTARRRSHMPRWSFLSRVVSPSRDMTSCPAMDLSLVWSCDIDDMLSAHCCVSSVCLNVMLVLNAENEIKLILYLQSVDHLWATLTLKHPLITSHKSHSLLLTVHKMSDEIWTSTGIYHDQMSLCQQFYKTKSKRLLSMINHVFSWHKQIILFSKNQANWHICTDLFSYWQTASSRVAEIRVRVRG